MTSNWNREQNLPVELVARADHLITWLLPTEAAHTKRATIIRYISKIMKSTFGENATTRQVGSYPLKTYLPSADIDLLVLLDPPGEKSRKTSDGDNKTLQANDTRDKTLHSNNEPSDSSDKKKEMQGNPVNRDGGVSPVSGAEDLVGETGSGAWAILLSHAFNCHTLGKDDNLSPQCIFDNRSSSSVPETENNSAEKGFRIQSTTFINAEVKIVRCVINNVTVDISSQCKKNPDAVNSIASVAVFERLDIEVSERTGHSNLFKRSVLLIKTFCLLETPALVTVPVLGSTHGGLCTYALMTMTALLFRSYPISHPLQALIAFCGFYAPFNWDNFCVTIDGAVPLRPLSPSSLPVGSDQGFASSGKACELTPSSIRCVNIQDPVCPKNNIGRSVSAAGLQSMREALAHGHRCLSATIQRAMQGGTGGASVSAAINMFDRIFPRTWAKYGRGDGWRPDLLQFPSEIWIPEGRPFRRTLSSLRSHPSLSALQAIVALHAAGKTGEGDAYISANTDVINSTLRSQSPSLSEVALRQKTNGMPHQSPRNKRKARRKKKDKSLESKENIDTNRENKNAWYEYIKSSKIFVKMLQITDKIKRNKLVEKIMQNMNVLLDKNTTIGWITAFSVTFTILFIITLFSMNVFGYTFVFDKVTFCRTNNSTKIVDVSKTISTHTCPICEPTLANKNDEYRNNAILEALRLSCCIDDINWDSETSECSTDDVTCWIPILQQCCNYNRHNNHKNLVNEDSNHIIQGGEHTQNTLVCPTNFDAAPAGSRRSGRLVLWVPEKTTIVLSMPSDPESCGTPTWRHNNKLMKGERSQHLSLWTGVGASDGGEYTCICGDNVWSAVVAMLAPPRVRSTFKQLRIPAGESLRLEVTSMPAVTYNVTNEFGTTSIARVQSADPLRFVWFRNGIEVPGEHHRVLEVEHVRKGHSGTYHCIVSNAHGQNRWGEVVVIVTGND